MQLTSGHYLTPSLPPGEYRPYRRARYLYWLPNALKLPICLPGAVTYLPAGGRKALLAPNYPEAAVAPSPKEEYPNRRLRRYPFRRQTISADRVCPHHSASTLEGKWPRPLTGEYISKRIRYKAVSQIGQESKGRKDRQLWTFQRTHE